jgi:hypothetical protein
MTDVPLLHRLDVQRVLVFRALQLGDMLCAVPALRALRAAVPGAHITLAGLPWAAQFVQRFSCYIDAFIPFPGHPALPEQPADEARLSEFLDDVRQQDFSLAVQLHGSGEQTNAIVASFDARAAAGFCAPSADVPEHIHVMPYPAHGLEPDRLLALTSWLGAESTGTHLEFPLTRQDGEELHLSGVARGVGSRRYACIHPGARDRGKCWAPQRFAEVADRLAEEFGLEIVLTGSANERDLTSAVARHMRAPAINAASPISIGAMAALMDGASLLVSNDTGVSHIAAGLGLRSVVVFSKADITRWAPADRERHRCLWDPGGQHVGTVLQHARELLSQPD